MGIHKAQKGFLALLSVSMGTVGREAIFLFLLILLFVPYVACVCVFVSDEGEQAVEGGKGRGKGFFLPHPHFFLGGVKK